MKNKILLIGTGIMARIYADIIQDCNQSEVIAAVGNTQDSCRKFTKAYKVKTYPNQNIDQALSECDVNFAIITTPEWIRRKPVKEICKYNLPILLEKPFASTLEDSLFIKECLSQNEQFFDVCHVLRSSPRFQKMIFAVKNGDIGNIKHIFARRNSNNLRAQRVLGKFTLTNWLLPHDLDMVLNLVHSEVKSVFCTSQSSKYNDNDYLISIVKFANGVTANIENSWATPPLSSTGRSTLFEVFGDEGKVELDDDPMNLRIYNEENSVLQSDTYEHYKLNGVWKGYFADFLNYILRNFGSQTLEQKQSIIDHNIKMARIQNALEVSRKENQVIYL